MKKIGIVILFFVLLSAVGYGAYLKNFPQKQILYPFTDIQNSDLPEIPDTKAMCDAVGGVWRNIGISPREQCNIKTSDGGFGCIDSKACDSLCIADLTKDEINKIRESKKIIKTRGKCADWRIIVGCHPVVIEGAVSGLMCID